jgi:hypothetical protein
VDGSGTAEDVVAWNVELDTDVSDKAPADVDCSVNGRIEGVLSEMGPMAVLES